MESRTIIRRDSYDGHTHTHPTKKVFIYNPGPRFQWLSLPPVTWSHFGLSNQPIFMAVASYDHMTTFYVFAANQHLLTIFGKNASHEQSVHLKTVMFTEWRSLQKKIITFHRSHGWPTLQLSQFMAIMGRLHCGGQVQGPPVFGNDPGRVFP